MDGVRYHLSNVSDVLSGDRDVRAGDQSEFRRTAIRPLGEGHDSRHHQETPDLRGTLDCPSF